MIYRLTGQGRLPVKTAIAFGGVKASWDRLLDVKRVVVAEADPVRRSVAVQIAYRYIRVQPWSDTSWCELGELGDSYRLDFPDLDRLIAFTSNRGPKEKKDISEGGFSRVGQERRSPNWGAIFQGIDLTDADDLRSSYGLIRTYEPPYEFETYFREAFARVRVGREPEMVRAITTWPDFGIFELRYLLDALPSPLPKHVSLRNAVRDAVIAACRREPERVRRRGWGALIPFAELDAEGLVPDGDVVRATLEGFTAQVDTLGAGELFQLVSLLSACSSPEEADEALNFGLDLLEDVLRPEDGDGPWRSELQPFQSVISSLAGYVWAGLGSPVVAERWQYAHVVRSVVELGWTELLEALIAVAESGVAGPFVDQRLEFYVWHARQWLLIGLARGGLENVAALRAAAPLLQLLVHEEHVLIRDLAAQALRTLVNAGELRAEEAGDLNSVNRPSLPEEVYTEWRDPVEHEALASEEALDEDERYCFGIDIGPYWFKPLGRAFGLTEDAMERRARHALRQRMGWGGGGGWRQDARHTRRIFDERETYHSHGSLPKADDLLAYHGYHAMMLVAAALLKERPVRRRANEATDEFHEWLSDQLLTRTDGKWLADRRDPRLVVEPPSPDGYGDRLWCWSVTAEYLDQKLVTDDGLLVFWGHWSSGERDQNETVSVRSALASRPGAEALVAALQTAPELGRFNLPSDGEGEREDLVAGALRLWGWVTNENVSARLDEGDPWAEGLHYPGPVPSKDTIAKLGLSASTDGRTWTAGTNGLVRSEIWTHTRGYGRETETISGWRLSGNGGFLRHLLDAHPESCLLIAVEVRRRPPRNRGNEPEFEPYPQPYVRYYLMEENGVAHAL